MKFGFPRASRVALVCALSVGCGSSAKAPANGGAGGGAAGATAGSAGSSATAGAGGAAGTTAAVGGAGGAAAGAGGGTAGAGGGTAGAGGGTAGAGGGTAGAGGGIAGAGGAVAGAGGGIAGAGGGTAGAGGGTAGAGGGAQACDVTRPFGTPVLVGGINGTGQNAEGRLSPDELTIYFYSDRGGNNDLYTATRASRTDDFGTPQPMTSVNTTSAEGWPSVTSNGMNLFLESNVSGKYAIYVATRTTLVAEFSAPALVATINTAGSDNAQPFILPDESGIYYVSNIGGGSYDIWRASRSTAGVFATPIVLSTLNTPSDEYAPTPSADDLVLYFGSARSDSPAKGGMDIWMTKRASTTASFDPPTNIQELNTANYEWPDWLSADRCRLYLTRTNGGVTTGQSIYVATRT